MTVRLRWSGNRLAQAEADRAYRKLKNKNPRKSKPKNAKRKHRKSKKKLAEKKPAYDGTLDREFFSLVKSF